MGSLYIEAQGCFPVLLENLHGRSCSGTCLGLALGSWLVLGFSVGMEAFDELLSINIPWSLQALDLPERVDEPQAGTQKFENTGSQEAHTLYSISSLLSLWTISSYMLTSFILWK